MTPPVTVTRNCWCGCGRSRVVGEFDPSVAPRRELIECEGCGALALHPQPDDEELSAAYSREYYGSSRRKFIAPVAAAVGAFQGGRARLVARLVPRGAKVLDVGCGNGGFLMEMRRREYSVEGTEWSAESAARVPPEANAIVHVGDLTALSLTPAGYDAVTLWHVFEHLRDPVRTLQVIRSLLSPRGVLVMSMPNVESAQARRYGAHWLHHDPPRHLYGFGPRSLNALLEREGFAVERIDTRSLEQNPFGEVQSALNRRGLPRDRLYERLKGLGRCGLAATAADLVRAAALTPVALVRDALESRRGEGATMTVIARSAR